MDYSDLLTLISREPEERARKDRRSKTVGARFSRFVSLSDYAVKTGKWPSGSPMSPAVVVKNVIERFQTLTAEDLRDLTKNARLALERIGESDKVSAALRRTYVAQVIQKLVQKNG